LEEFTLCPLDLFGQILVLDSLQLKPSLCQLAAENFTDER